MLAIAGVVLAVIAGILQLVNRHQDLVIWLLIAAVILVGADAAWGWHRGGRYGRRAAP